MTPLCSISCWIRSSTVFQASKGDRNRALLTFANENHFDFLANRTFSHDARQVDDASVRQELAQVPPHGGHGRFIRGAELREEDAS